VSQYRVLIPTTNPSRTGPLLRFASAFTQGDEPGTLLGILEVPSQRDARATPEVAHAYRTLLSQTTRQARDLQGVRPLVRIAHVAAQGIREVAIEADANLLLLDAGAGGRAPADGQWTNAVEDLLYDPPCQAVLIRPADGSWPIRSVLVPVRGGPHAELAVRLGHAICQSAGAELCLLHVFNPKTPQDARAREQGIFDRLVAAIDAPLRKLTVSSAAVRETIIAETGRHQVTILGATLSLMHRPMVLGLPLNKLLRRLAGTVLVVKTPGPARHPAGAADLPVRVESRAAVAQWVDRWFAENTFHYREFAPLRRLLDLKQRQGLVVSLALPTQNNERTIGPTVRTLRRACMERMPLIDEILVVDSASTDRTARQAQAAGATVVQHADVLARYGSFPGAGDALWKSLYVLKGDLVCWLDPALAAAHPGVVYGLLGPLLTDPEIHYVKAFFGRPAGAKDSLPQGGDRVTELAARPLLNLLFPELSGFIQPLDRQSAGRRRVLQSVPYQSGEGVEIGLLLTIAEAFGIKAIAQVDVGRGRRAPPNPQELSRTAFAIVQVALKRLGERHRIHLLEDVNRTMKLIRYEDERFFIEQAEVEDVERPPMDTVPEYFLARRR